MLVRKTNKQLNTHTGDIIQRRMDQREFLESESRGS